MAELKKKKPAVFCCSYFLALAICLLSGWFRSPLAQEFAEGVENGPGREGWNDAIPGKMVENMG